MIFTFKQMCTHVVTTCIVAMLIVLPGHIAFAQFGLGGAPSLGGLGVSGSVINFTTSPSVPGPNQDVTISAESYNYDLNRTTVSWYVNGTLETAGKGKKRHTVRTGSIGEATTVRVVATTENGTTFERSITLAPLFLDLYWEAHTFTPPFYKGKAMHTASTWITISALPVFADRAGKTVSPAALNYAWKVDSQPLTDESGVGAHTIQIQNKKFVKPMNIEVSVTDPNSPLSGKKAIRIPVDQPELLFSENPPLLGILYNTAMTGQIELINSEISILAEPLFFQGNNRTDFAYDRIWRIDSTPVEAGETITLKPTGDSAGVSTVDLTLKRTDNPVQSARNQLRVLYESSGTGGGTINQGSFFNQ